MAIAHRIAHRIAAVFPYIPDARLRLYSSALLALRWPFPGQSSQVRSSDSAAMESWMLFGEMRSPSLPCLTDSHSTLIPDASVNQLVWHYLRDCYDESPNP